jgi:hypothetical protein
MQHRLAADFQTFSTNPFSLFPHKPTGFQTSDKARLDDLVDIDPGDFWIDDGDDALHDFIRRWIRRHIEGGHPAQHAIGGFNFFGFLQPEVPLQNFHDFEFVAAIEDKRGRFS